MLGVGVLAFIPAKAESAEIAPFRITDIQAELALSYFFDEYTTASADTDNTYRTGSTFQEQLDILVRSYIYHPNLVQLDFGGGPVFLQNSYDSDLVNRSSNEQFFNFHAKANILKEKDYPLTLYYQRSFSSSSPAVQDRMLLEKNRYGLDFSLKQPFLMAPLFNLSLSSFQTDGGNAQRTVDESTDQASLTVSTDFGTYGDGSIGYYWLKEHSSSGSRGLPITPTTRTTNSLNIQTRHIFGSRRQILVNNHLSYKKQDNLPSLEETWFKPSVNWTHSDNLTSYYRYSFRDWTTEQTDSQTNLLNLGATHYRLDKRLQISADTQMQDYQTEGYQQNFYSGSLSLSYLQEFKLFNVQYSAGWTIDKTDREAAITETPVFAEHHILNDTTPVSLSRKYVVAGSVKVRNLSSTQVYVENADYRLIISGDTTQIQRIPTGNISDGEEIQVDYSFETGGTAAFTSVAQRYRVDVYRGQYIRVFGKYHNLERSLDSGDPTLPLNSVKETVFGLSFNIPFWDTWAFGGSAEVQDYEDEIIPYKGSSYTTFLQMPTPLNGRLRIYADRQIVDKQYSPEDIDLTRWGLRYSSSPWRRTTMTINIIDEEDVGGTRMRSNTSASLRFDWAIRQLKLSADARYNSDSIDASERERTRFNITLSRRF